MEVANIPIPAAATIKVSKEGKSVVFDTMVVQTTDNKYIYCLPVRRDKRLVNFDGQGLVKEIRVQVSEEEVYVWKNVIIAKFVEDKRIYLRVRTVIPAIVSNTWQSSKAKSDKKKTQKQEEAVGV